jgi:hypothetical protein
MATTRVNLPRHIAGFDAHIEMGPHGFALFLASDAEYPMLDIDGTPRQLDDVVRRLHAALASLHEARDLRRPAVRGDHLELSAARILTRDEGRDRA